MSIVVNTNVSSLIAQNSLTKATNALQTAMQRMTTGSKLNSAKDDAAGLYISTNLDTAVRGSKIAQSNVQIGANVLEKAEGDLSVIQDNLTRIRDLAVTAANGVYDADSLAAIKSEVDARIAEINRIANSSEFSGQKLLAKTGTISSLTLQVGPDAEAATNAITISNVFGDATATTLGLSTATATAFASSSAAASFIGEVDDALSEVADRRTAIGAYQNRLDSTYDSLTTSIQNLSAARSTIVDADIATESANYVNAQILQQASAALLAQANQLPAIALSLITG